MIRTASDLLALVHLSSTNRERSLAKEIKDQAIRLDKEISQANSPTEVLELKSFLNRTRSLSNIDKRLVDEIIEDLDTRMSPIETLADFGIINPTPNEIYLTKKLLHQSPDIISIIDFSQPDGLSLLHLLYDLCDYLGFDKFQLEKLEPFNKKFPEIPFDKAPRSIKALDFSKEQEIPMPLNNLKALEELVLYKAGPQVLEEVQMLPQFIKKRIKRLRISTEDLVVISTDSFPNLQELHTQSKLNPLVSSILNPSKKQPKAWV